MRNLFYILLFAFLGTSCKVTQQTQLTFFDEFIISDTLHFKNAKIGGLSGIDFVNDSYFFVVDDPRNPRILEARITIKNDKIKDINFKNSIELNKKSSSFYKENHLDLESIFVDEKTKEIYLVSEGSIHRKKLPSIFKTDSLGNFMTDFKLPENLSTLKNIKNNAVFEGSSKSVDNKGFWVAMEGPLKMDGEDPSFIKQSSPIRITYFDKNTKEATKQFAYQLEHLTRPAKGNVNLNGATALLEFKKNHFLIIERIYQSDYGLYGNTIRIFEAIIDENTTNTLEIDALKNVPFTPLKKRLLLDFNTVKDKLTNGIIDNIEGITFGPRLENGNQSLIIISDDNFQVYGKQLNQIILLELKTN